MSSCRSNHRQINRRSRANNLCRGQKWCVYNLSIMGIVIIHTLRYHVVLPTTCNSSKHATAKKANQSSLRAYRHNSSHNFYLNSFSTTNPSTVQEVKLHIRNINTNRIKLNFRTNTIWHKNSTMDIWTSHAWDMLLAALLNNMHCTHPDSTYAFHRISIHKFSRRQMKELALMMRQVIITKWCFTHDKKVVV